MPYIIQDQIIRNTSIFTKDLNPGDMRVYNAFKNFQFLIVCQNDNTILLRISILMEDQINNILQDLDITLLNKFHEFGFINEYNVVITKEDCDKFLTYLKLIGEL